MSGTVTFLLSDIEGSTALLRRLGRERYGELLWCHQELLREVFASYRGEEIDTQGDAFFVAFRSTSDAVAAAVAIQRALAAEEWPDGVEVRVRIGLHTGEAAAARERYIGFSVHRAARVGAAAHGGQILLSSTTRDLLEDDLPQGITLRDLGSHELKDIERPERLAQVVAEGLPAEFPPLRGAQPLKPPSRVRGRSLLAGALAGVIAAAVAIPVFALGGKGGGTALARVGADAVGVIDSAGHVTDSITATVSPTSVAFGARRVWVTSADANSVVEIDPDTGTKVQTYEVGKGPTGVAYGDRFVWVANSLDNTVTQIDPGAPRPVNTIPVGNGPVALAYGDGSVWVANSGDRTVMRIDPKTGKVKRRYQPLERLGGAGRSGLANSCQTGARTTICKDCQQ